VAIAAGVKQLALYHHDPLRSDAGIDEVLAACRARALGWGSSLEIIAAAEGALLDFPELAAARKRHRMETAVDVGMTRVDTATVLVVDDDPNVIGLVQASLQGEGYRFLSAENGRIGLQLARTETPDLMLLNWEMPEMDGLAVCRAIRADPNPAVRHMPIVMLTARSASEDTKEGFDAGADDYITKPITPAHVRTRVREWLIRGKAPPLGHLQ
jgi:CheY-like chemotaxis protein